MSQIPLGRAPDWLERLARVNIAIGRVSAWLTLGAVVTTFATVVARYGFGFSASWLSQAYVWQHAAAFALCAAWTFSNDGHVRVDMFYRGASPRRKAWINLVGACVALIPWSLILLYVSAPYAMRSWAIGETTQEQDGIPALFLLKTVLPVFAAMMLVEGVVLVARSWAFLRGDAPAVALDAEPEAGAL